MLQELNRNINDNQNTDLNDDDLVDDDNDAQVQFISNCAAVVLPDTKGLQEYWSNPCLL